MTIFSIYGLDGILVYRKLFFLILYFLYSYLNFYILAFDYGNFLLNNYSLSGSELTAWWFSVIGLVKYSTYSLLKVLTPSPISWPCVFYYGICSSISSVLCLSSCIIYIQWWWTNAIDLLKNLAMDLYDIYVWVH